MQVGRAGRRVEKKGEEQGEEPQMAEDEEGERSEGKTPSPSEQAGCGVGGSGGPKTRKSEGKGKRPGRATAENGTNSGRKKLGRRRGGPPVTGRTERPSGRAGCSQSFEDREGPPRA